MGQNIPVCTDAQLQQGESFEWVNSGKTDCEITQCDPPLEKNRYDVAAGSSTPAKVRDHAERKTHYYRCECGKGKLNNPKIIIS
jgi:hypothetical protein